MDEVLLRLVEKSGAIEQKADAAHKRLDSMQGEYRDMLKELISDMKSLREHMDQELKELHKDANISKGKSAVWMLVATVLGSAMGAIVSYVLK